MVAGMQEKLLPMGEVVGFNFGSVSGVGEIIGVATSHIPPLGVGYMVEVCKSEPPLPSDFYPYKAITVFESQIITGDELSQLEQQLAK
jgi:hypothetical protein